MYILFDSFFLFIIINQNEVLFIILEIVEIEGFQGFNEFEDNLVEVFKGVLKFDMLKYDLEKFIVEVKVLLENLSKIMEN